eukprot:2692744-Rhodomonas_salina.1
MSAEQEQLKDALTTSMGILAGRSGSGKTEVLLNVGLAVVLALRKATPVSEDVEASSDTLESRAQAVIPALLVTQSALLAKSLKQRAANMLRVAACTPPDDFETWPLEDQRAFLQDIVEGGLAGRADLDLAEPADFKIGTETPDMLTLTVRQTLRALDRTLKGRQFFGRSADLQTHGHDFKHGEVTFERFRQRMWPKMAAKAGKLQCSAESVFKEIMEIKARNEGSAPAELRLRTLSREEYVESTQRGKSFADKADRERMYRLFQEYEQSKGEGDWDVCDLCASLWARFRSHGYAHGQKVAKLLSDESQDLHRSEIL